MSSTGYSDSKSSHSEHKGYEEDENPQDGLNQLNTYLTRFDYDTYETDISHLSVPQFLLLLREVYEIQQNNRGDDSIIPQDVIIYLYHNYISFVRNLKIQVEELSVNEYNTSIVTILTSILYNIGDLNNRNNINLLINLIYPEREGNEHDIEELVNRIANNASFITESCNRLLSIINTSFSSDDGPSSSTACGAGSL